MGSAGAGGTTTLYGAVVVGDSTGSPDWDAGADAGGAGEVLRKTVCLWFYVFSAVLVLFRVRLQPFLPVAVCGTVENHLPW